MLPLIALDGLMERSVIIMVPICVNSQRIFQEIMNGKPGIPAVFVAVSV